MFIHNVIDLSPLYFRYKASYELAHKLQKLTYKKDNGEEKDVTIMYHVLKDIESFRVKAEQQGHKVVTTVCIDSKCIRDKMLGTTESNEYKSGRTLKLNEEDRENIKEMEEMLRTAGHKVMICEGAEADDLVRYAVQRYRDTYDHTMVYTNDKDLLTNICRNVSAWRFKSVGGWTGISENNYSKVLSNEFGCNIKYNAIALYLCTVGDSADHIKGIVGFGPKAYDKMIDSLANKYPNFKWDMLSDYENVAKVLVSLKEEIGEEKFKQAVTAFNLVRPIEITDNDSDENGRIEYDEHGLAKISLKYIGKTVLTMSSRDSREKAYSRYNMKSLY